MALHTTSIACTLFFCLRIVLALPSQNPELLSRQTPDCTSTNPESFYLPSCYAALDLTNWLNDWHAPRVYTDADNGVGCCGANEEWSTCFLRLGKADSGLNCSQTSVNTNDCAYSSALAPDLDPKIAPQVRYVLRTIFNINAFFNDWYNALQFATTQASLTIDSIVTAVDPVPSTSIAFTDILSALIAGFPFIGSPLFVTEIAASTAAKALVTGLQQAPGLVKSLWPTGSPESQIIQIGTLSTELKNANDQLGQHQISTGLQLFVLSKALNGNKYQAEVLNTASIVPDALPDFCEYKGTKICYQNDTLFGGVTYILEKTDANDGIHSAKVVQKIMQGGWATLDQLFQYPFDCAASGQLGQNVISLDANGGFDVSCLSQLTECNSGNDCNIGGKCPIQDYPNPYN